MGESSVQNVGSGDHYSATGGAIEKTSSEVDAFIFVARLFSSRPDRSIAVPSSLMKHRQSGPDSERGKHLPRVWNHKSRFSEN